MKLSTKTSTRSQSYTSRRIIKRTAKEQTATDLRPAAGPNIIMCQGKKYRMACGHFHLNFYERCDSWCHEPQVQLITHREEQCGHCVAKAEVESWRANYGRYYNKEKQRFIAAYRSYCDDGKREALVSLREKSICANREVRALKEEFPYLEDLESDLEKIRREQTEIKSMIPSQTRLVEAEGDMKELLPVHKETTSRPELGRLDSMKRRLEHLESCDKNLRSHDNLAKLDIVKEHRSTYQSEEKMMAEERLSCLKSIGSRLRHQAMEEKEKVKQARRAGRAATRKEPESDLDPELQVPFHDSLYHILKTSRQARDVHNFYSNHNEDDEDFMNTVMVLQPSADHERYHIQSIDKSLDAETATDGSQTPRIFPTLYPPQYSTTQSKSAASISRSGSHRYLDDFGNRNRSDEEEVLSDDPSEADILLDLIRYDNLSPTAVSSPRHSPYSDAPRNPTLSPISLLSSGLNDSSQWMTSGATGTSDSLHDSSFARAMYEDPVGEEEEGEAPRQVPKPSTTPRKQARESKEDQVPSQATSGTISPSSTVLPLNIQGSSGPSPRIFHQSPAESGSRWLLKATESMHE
ncbi:hypothetical protein QBC36DRAFT_6380 [Triangularia setosa]|uniref:Uncharacterized protein n=1 Tax=Triangularia setosa TaxID=2587417 RepID=A0AAN6WF00_9PEZI|nr:hypothetical protein QBC36DRAFT_6380 [Podospora setosa]